LLLFVNGSTIKRADKPGGGVGEIPPYSSHANVGVGPIVPSQNEYVGEAPTVTPCDKFGVGLLYPTGDIDGRIVAAGIRVDVGLGRDTGGRVEVGIRVDVGRGAEVGIRVDVGMRVEVGIRVDVGMRVEVGAGGLVGVRVRVGVLVRVGVRVASGVGEAHADKLEVHWAPGAGQQYVVPRQYPILPAALQSCTSPSGSEGVQLTIIQYPLFCTF